jgi:ribonuclease T1
MIRIFAFLLAALVALTALPGFAAEPAELRRFARELRLTDVDGFVATVQSIRATGKLSERYLDKDDAAKLGWRPGADLCRIAPGKLIGGDRFMNREGRLPAAPGRRWTEADLDYGCGRRNAKRLVFSSDRRIFVTVDHYETFREVPK